MRGFSWANKAPRRGVPAGSSPKLVPPPPPVRPLSPNHSRTLVPTDEPLNNGWVDWLMLRRLRAGHAQESSPHDVSLDAQPLAPATPLVGVNSVVPSRLSRSTIRL